jgi:hypothetical protein
MNVIAVAFDCGIGMNIIHAPSPPIITSAPPLSNAWADGFGKLNTLVSYAL